MVRQHASVYQRSNGRLIVASLSRTAAGFGILNDSMQGAAADIEDSRLGVLVLEMMNASGLLPTPSPADYPLPQYRRLLALAGARSHKAFHTDCLSVDVYAAPDAEATSVVVVPTRNLGAKGGFEANRDLEERTSMADPAALGAAVRRGLARSE